MTELRIAAGRLLDDQFRGKSLDIVKKAPANQYNLHKHNQSSSSSWILLVGLVTLCFCLYFYNYTDVFQKVSIVGKSKTSNAEIAFQLLGTNEKVKCKADRVGNFYVWLKKGVYVVYIKSEKGVVQAKRLKVDSSTISL